ncbi:hypothetical protein FE257_000140 [Aspergillus nanangensis]|uniref:Uncharacterized protein n=1 Tax=Aspergillus nanangensis TaxID=2582783 RepID=A0AAD4CZC0_ASPNN|nr:hypothetical protein FE257_000140 [Aspergillus nanangensis]
MPGNTSYESGSIVEKSFGGLNFYAYYTGPPVNNYPPTQSIATGGENPRHTPFSFRLEEYNAFEICGLVDTIDVSLLNAHVRVGDTILDKSLTASNLRQGLLGKFTLQTAKGHFKLCVENMQLWLVLDFELCEKKYKEKKCLLHLQDKA